MRHWIARSEKARLSQMATRSLCLTHDAFFKSLVLPIIFFVCHPENVLACVYIMSELELTGNLARNYERAIAENHK